MVDIDGWLLDLESCVYVKPLVAEFLRDECRASHGGCREFGYYRPGLGLGPFECSVEPIPIKEQVSKRSAHDC